MNTKLAFELHPQYHGPIQPTNVSWSLHATNSTIRSWSRTFTPWTTTTASISKLQHTPPPSSPAFHCRHVHKPSLYPCAIPLQKKKENRIKTLERLPRFTLTMHATCTGTRIAKCSASSELPFRVSWMWAWYKDTAGKTFTANEPHHFRLLKTRQSHGVQHKDMVLFCSNTCYTFKRTNIVSLVSWTGWWK